MDARLGRKVLDHVTEHREQFDMTDWGREEECGTVACLAGWTMLLSGYTLDDYGEFRHPDGTYAGHLAEEARKLLRLSDAECCEGDGLGVTLFDAQGDERAIARFRALVEAAEAVSANG